MAITLTYDATLARVRVSAAGLVDPAPRTKFGAYLDPTIYGAADWAAAKTEWQAITGITLSAVRRFQATDYTVGTTLTQMIGAGVRILLSLGPPHSPVDATHRANIATMMANLRAAGADVRVSLWPEPFFSGLTATQYRDMIAYYGPTVRQYYPLWAVFSGTDTVEANGYIPGAGEIDGIAADHYYPTSTDSLGNCQAAADARGLPLGLWEFGSPFDFGINPSPVNGETNAAATAFYTGVVNLFQARAAAGKPNGDITFFSSLATTTGTVNFLGTSRSQLGGLEGGIGTWQAGGNCTLAPSSAQAHSGSGCLAVTATAAATMGIGHCTTANILTQGLTVTPGQKVGCSFWARPGSTARNVQAAVAWYDSAGTLLSPSSFGSTVAEVAGAWTFVSATATAPANAARAKFIPQILSPGAVGEVHFIDDPQIGVLPASTDHTAPIQYPWDYRIASLSAMKTALDGTGGVTGGVYRLERSTDQVRWTTVRGASAAVATAGGLAVPVDDYEFAPDVPNFYRLVSVDTGLVVPDSTDSITPDLGGQVWLKSVARPFLNRPVQVQDFSDVTRASRGATFAVVGRPDPIAVTEVRGSRQWALTVPIPVSNTTTFSTESTEATATTLTDEALDAILAVGDIMLVQVPAGSQVPAGYVLIGDVTRSRRFVHPKFIWWTLPCTEVAAPGPDVVGATSTWATVLDTYATWGDVLAANATWGDLLELVGTPAEVTAA